GEGSRQSRADRSAARALRPRRPRRTRLPAVQRLRRRIALPSAEQALRADQRHHHDQSQLRRVGNRVRRPEDDDRATRSSHPPLPHPRNRKRQLPLQEQLGFGQPHRGESRRRCGLEYGASAGLLDPLNMKDSSYTAEAIEAAGNHANGHHWTPEGVTETPFTPIFPYHLAGAGDINSNVEDMSRWIRLQLNGAFEGRRMVSSENFAFAHTPKVAVNDKLSYASGWYVYSTPNGDVIWHDGDALSFGSFVGMAPDKNIGVVILTNESNVGFPSALGLWVLDRILDNPQRDYAADALRQAKASFEARARVFASPANPRPFPPLAPLAGTFVNPSFGAAKISQDGDAL